MILKITNKSGDEFINIGKIKSIHVDGNELVMTISRKRQVRFVINGELITNVITAFNLIIQK